MSPAPALVKETLTINPLSNDEIHNYLSSTDENELTFYEPLGADTGLLTIDGADELDVSEDIEDDGNDQDQHASSEPTINITSNIQSAPSTPTGERDAPIGMRRASVNGTTDPELSRIEVKYQGDRTITNTNSDNNNGLFDTFLGCLKPFFSAVNKFGENIRYHRDHKSTTSAINKNFDDWYIPTDRIINDLSLVGSGNEGSVYRCKLDGSIVACKRVKSEAQTNIKHLRKLNHENIIKFRGVSVSPPFYYIVMEFCPYGSLYDVLRKRREKSRFTKPTQVLQWSKQIASGVHYLHANNIIHRDLKSPNILIADKNLLKISDFGTSKEISNRRSAPMSFNGTSAWMAPELIRSELCSEKIDVWSFGVVLWEILTCAVPYNNIDPVAVMWGVGKGSLTLPIPSSVPDAFKLLMTMCWNQKPDNRPTFHHILKHLDVGEAQIKLFEQEQEYAELTRAWSNEINDQLAKLPAIDITATLQMTNDELMKKRQEQLQHIADIRAHYEMKVQKVNTLYIELTSLMMQLEKRQREIEKRERQLSIHDNKSSGGISGKKKAPKAILEARTNSIKLIKNASLSIHDVKLSQNLSLKKPVTDPSSTSQATPKPKTTTKSVYNDPVSHTQTEKHEGLPSNNHESTSARTSQRRKKTMGHNRTGSRGSVVSWTPPTLSHIDEQEKIRASMKSKNNDVVNNKHDEDNSPLKFHPGGSIDVPLPSISADVDSKSKGSMRGLNPKSLELDVKTNFPSKPHESIGVTHINLSRKLSSSDPEDFEGAETKRNSIRQRRRRSNNLQNSRSASPSSIASRSIKGSLQDATTPIAEEKTQIEHFNDLERTFDSRKIHRAVSFHHTPSIKSDRSPSYQTRKSFNQSNVYTSSEEGEVDEMHSDHFVLDDEKHRAKHEDMNRKSYGIFSSESEIYGEINRHSLSSRNESAFSDEGGHVSDERPASRESILNSEID